MEFDRVPAISKYLSVVFLLAWLGRSTVWNFLPIYFERHIASVFLIGVITSLPAAIPLLLDIPVGNLVQRAGAKIVIFLGLTAAIAPPLFYVTTMPLLLVLGKLSEGFAKVLMWNGGWSISLKVPDSDIESEAISVFLLGVNLSVIVGPIIGGYLIASEGFPLTFGLWVITSVLAVMVFYSYIGLQRKRGLIDSVETLFHRKTYIDDWHHIKDNWEELRYPVALIFLQSIIFSFYWLAIPLLLNDMQKDFKIMGIVFGIAALPKGFQFIFGDIADSIGDFKIVAILGLLLVPALAVINFVSGIIAVGVFFFISRLLTDGMSPAMHALFDDRTPDDLEGELTGVLEFFKHSGQTLGPLIAGTAASIWSVNASFLAASFISALIFLVAFLELR